MRLKCASINETTYTKILDSFTSIEYVKDIDKYMQGYKNKHTIYYNERYIICNWAKLIVLNLVEDDGTNGDWYQVVLRLEIEQKENIDNIKVMTPPLALRMINKEINSKYSKDEVEKIFNTHEKENSEILHTSIAAKRNVITQYNDCIYYDANGAYASELIKLFPKCKEKFEYWFINRHENNNYFKNLFNYYVGQLTQNKNKAAENAVKGIKLNRELHPKTRHYIVDNISNMLLNLIYKIDGMDIYTNTDGHVSYKPKNRIDGSKEIGSFKIEYEGTVYTYKGANYTIIQMGDEIKGNLPLELRSMVDLRVGKVVEYEKYLVNENNNSYYKTINVKQKYIEEIEIYG